MPIRDVWAVGAPESKAVAGGQLAPQYPVGALIGSLTAVTKEIEKIKRVTLCLSADNGNTSWIHFVSETTSNSLKESGIEKAQKWARIIENYMIGDTPS